MFSVPALLQLVALMFSVPPLSVSVAPLALLNVLGEIVSVPALTLTAPLLVNTLGLMVRLWPVVFATIVPALTIVDAELWLIDPNPCTVTPGSMVSVWASPLPAWSVPPARRTGAPHSEHLSL